MARRRKIDREMSSAVAYDRLAAKASKAGNGHQAALYMQRSNQLKARVYTRQERRATK